MGKKLEKRSIPANILIYLILILLAVSYLYPLYFMGCLLYTSPSPRD